VGEVDDVEHPEDEREPDGKQEQQDAVRETVQCLREEIGEDARPS
jgi:hypothetical protein